MPSRIGSNQFSKRLRFHRDRFEKNAEGIVKTAARASLEVMVMNTRIDTSQMVSNWLVTRDGPSSDFIEAHTPGAKGSTAGASMAETLAAGRAEIELFDINGDADLFITNNTPYLRYNEGSTLTAMGQQAARSAIAGAKLFA